ncbi:hypothetical protein M011DRAFT_466467 [Sporormia fimetaria CBS 119925]|uniref:Uncharacterized protein n=1 Tax=Sporormia fimetaria CBS 119925 TaxID=1340428 RepID=A0A6A6VDN7_9PLEO|nr:hypothetical protein M011DRAFT_466467 [Sporormia fimetaria CBS 119925]
MHFSILSVVALAAIGAALPHHPLEARHQIGDSRGHRGPGRVPPGAGNIRTGNGVNGGRNRRPGKGNRPSPPPAAPPPNNDDVGNDIPAGGNSAFDASLVPEFGIEPGQQPDGTGNCVGVNNVLIPCSCPPDRQEFIQQVQAAAAAGNSEGVPISFPTGSSSADARARIGASIIVLQNLNGRGVGCPAASTTFLQQQAALNK